MTLGGFLVLLLIAGLAGFVGQAIAGYSLGGLVITIIVGFSGAYVGTWLAKQFNLPLFLQVNVDGRSFPLVWAIAGSALVSAILGFLVRRMRVL